MVLRETLFGAALVCLSTGLVLQHVDREHTSPSSRTQDAPAKKERRRFGVLSAGADYIKAQRHLDELKRYLDENMTEYYKCGNESIKEAKRSKHFDFKAQTLINDEVERVKMLKSKKKYLRDETLFEARQDVEDPNMTDVYIPTNHKRDSIDDQLERSRKEIMKRHPNDFNITRFQDLARTAAFNAERWEVRGAYRQFRIEEIKTDIEAAEKRVEKAGDSLKRKPKEVAATRERMSEEGAAEAEDPGDEQATESAEQEAAASTSSTGNEMEE